jgi:hypothetical protein
MADALSTIAKLINSPPGQLVAGGVLAGIVWKFFERVESVLTDQTKFEIAVWLVGFKTADKIPWPDTFAKIFDRVFGKRHLSGRCFIRSAIASVLSLGISFFAMYCFHPFMKLGFDLTISAWLGANHHFVALSLLFIIVLTANVLPDFVSLLETRYILARMRFFASEKSLLLQTTAMIVLILVDLIVTYAIAFFASILGNILVTRLTLLMLQWKAEQMHSQDIWQNVGFLIFQGMVPFITVDAERFWWWIYPAFFTSIWLWLYAGSGFLIKAARRFDIGFDWFNRKFDVERKPLQSIGLVSGCIVAIVYWTTALVHYYA